MRLTEGSSNRRLIPIAQNCHLANKLPRAFLDRQRALLPPPAFEVWLESISQARPTVFRFNALKTTALQLTEELLAAGLEPQPLGWMPNAFILPPAQRRALTESAACREGRLYIQNLSSMIPPLVLDPKPTEWILDLAAAPGSKTTQLAALMGNQGRISAVESVRSRFFRLKANLRGQGVTNTRCYLKDGAQVWRLCPERFDRILLDAPCSSEARFSLVKPASFTFWSEKKRSEMSRKQRRLLFSAVQSLKPGGILVYSTCAFSPEENEAILDDILRLFAQGLQAEAVSLPFPADKLQPGLAQWQNRIFTAELRNAVRILPDVVREGFFICKLRKLKSTLQEKLPGSD
jgi:NOL1/NOP2/sun family putative RNA methylase